VLFKIDHIFSAAHPGAVFEIESCIIRKKKKVKVVASMVMKLGVIYHKAQTHRSQAEWGSVTSAMDFWSFLTLIIT